MNPDLLRYDFLPPDLPEPWARTGWFQVGGLLHVGFGPEQDLLLVESPNGSSIIDVMRGKKIARDESFVSTQEQARSLLMPGFDVLAGQMISMAGIWGGGLRRTTGDRFKLSRQAPYWPDERIVLHLPDKRGNPPRYFQALVLAEPASTIHAYGFSDTGHSFAVATASEVFLFARR